MHLRDVEGVQEKCKVAVCKHQNFLIFVEYSYNRSASKISFTSRTCVSREIHDKEMYHCSRGYTSENFKLLSVNPACFVDILHTQGLTCKDVEIISMLPGQKELDSSALHKAKVLFPR